MLTQSKSGAGSWERAVGEVAESVPQKHASQCPLSSMSAAVKNLNKRHPEPKPSNERTSVPASGPRETAVRISTIAYGLLAYAMFGGTILYAIGWLGNWFVPKSIDSGAAAPLAEALIINTLLLSLFVVQHTIMARPVFKAWWTRFVPRAIERSTFVIAASVCLILTFALWRPLPTVVWQVTNPVAWWGLTALSLSGWAIVLLASFMVSHFDLFGLRQTWFRSQGRRYRPVGFRLVGFYRLVRHPLMVGFLIWFWSTPQMSLGHLFFAVMTTGYIFFGTWIEERDLIAQHGEDYLAYRRKVRGFVPIPKAA